MGGLRHYPILMEQEPTSPGLRWLGSISLQTKKMPGTVSTKRLWIRYSCQITRLLLDSDRRKRNNYTCLSRLPEYPFYNTEKKRVLTTTLHMTWVTISPFSIFVQHGIRQHARDDWEGMSFPCYLDYFILAYINVESAVPLRKGGLFTSDLVQHIRLMMRNC